MGKLLIYNGSDKVKKRIADVLNVTDIQSNGVSIVDENGIATISFDPTDIIHIDTKAHWDAQRTLVGQSGHIYVYTDKDVVDNVNIPAIKVGDGTSYLIDMAFVDSNVKELIDHMADTTVHITQAERTFWNNKVTCFMSQVDTENLVFSKD